jgi:hypothetical protein
VGGRTTLIEHTQYAELSGIVTEKGTLLVAGVESWLAAIKLHPALASCGRAVAS